ncbi:hypothetical protein [Providencia rettgeri]|uniref:tail fiber/spike domain-containing protein n=1 Tax=Providencia rettgeri TaxID=587 RepID=UPI0005B4C98E|nr:hypothetical protein [Providencia rettgeri]
MREVKPTQKPVPSSDIKDLFFNSGLLDIWATSLEHKYIDRFGSCHLTAAGMEWLFKELVEKFKVDMNTAIVAAGYITIDSFQQGADLPNNEITLRNHILRDETTGEYYRWDGDLPKQVPAGSTPQSTGGIGKGAWVSVGDASLRGSITNEKGYQLIGGLKDNYSRRFPNVASMISALDITDGMLVSTQGFYQKGDDGEANYIISSNLSADGANIIALDNGLFAKLTGESVSALSLGFKNDEELDQSDLFDTTMKYRGGKVIFDGVNVKVSSYSKLSRAFDFINGAKIIASPSSPINLFEIDVNDTEFGHISIDCGNKALLPIRITGSGNTIRKIKIENLHAPLNTGTGVIGIQIRGSNNTIGTIEGADCQNTGNSNLSMPQLVHVYEGSTGGYIDSISTVRCCSVLNAANDNEISVGRMRLINSQDNGIYGGGKITVGHFYYDGDEEPLAFTDNADVTINLAEIGGNGLGAISYNNMKRININHLRLFRGSDGKTPLSVVNIRSADTSSGTLHIGEISGEVEPVRFLSIDKGFTQRLIIDKCNLDIIYDPAKMTGSLSDIRNAGSFSIGEINIRVIDKDDSMSSQEKIFQFQFPVSPKTTSTVNRINFHGVKSDRVTLQPNAVFRGESLRHPNVYVQNGCWQVNIGPYLREITWNIGWTQTNGVQLNPTIGYWRKGEDFALINATSAGPFRTRCVESGTPGVWKAY